MTTVSGTVSFKMTRDTMSLAALRLVGAIDPENTIGPSPTQLANCAEAANLLVKEWENTGLELWVREYAAVFLQKKQQSYVFNSPISGDPACYSSPLGTGFLKTTGSGSGSSIGLSAVSTVATEGIPAITIATGWNIGVQQPTGEMVWSTVQNISGTGVTTNTSIGTCTNGIVYAFKDKLPRPMRLLDGFYRSTGVNDIPCLIIPRENYNRFGMKSSNGVTIQLYYDPQAYYGTLYVYPTSMATDGVLYLEISRPLDDMTSSTDDFDFPTEWLNTFKWNLALSIAPEYEVSEAKYKQIQYMAQTTLAAARSYDQEAASLYLQPSNWTYTDNRGY